jgi:D-glycero-D-manno-heptose 1,7-bisphosphate phosphatase
VTERAALFLDRDGVINVDAGYVHTVEAFQFLPGIFETVRAAASLGLETVVVTNQAGIGRGYYSEAQFVALTAWMCNRFMEEGAALLAVYHCPFHADAVPPYNIADHPDRKPNPGMLQRAALDHRLDLGKSLLIGDRPGDIAAASAAGLLASAVLGDHAIDGVEQLEDHRAAAVWLQKYQWVFNHN